jgi:hypothetical protein
MEPGCPCCGAPPAVGVLCATCAATVPPCDGLLPAHVTAPPGEALAWLIDGFGAPHALSGGRTVVGRRTDAELSLLHASVSRDHAELRREGTGWQLRDLGSRNGTHIDGRPMAGRELLREGARIRFGEVAFLFVAGAIAMPDVPGRSLATGHAASAFRFTIRGEAVELCLVADGGAGLLLHRTIPAGGAPWSEVALSPLDVELLRVLCVRAAEDAASPARTRGCVSTKELLRTLPFTSKLAGEENVRQAVHRLRTDLAALGAGELIGSQPGRGYFLAWPVTGAA